jgi:signal peptidase I
MDASTFILGATCLCGVAWLFERRAVANALAAAPAPDPTAPEPPPPSGLASLRSFLAPAFAPLLFVLVLRVGIAEPFRIPSGSMMPGLVSGDFILVDKGVWGVKLPWGDGSALIPERRPPARGDVAVFRFPKEPSVDYIKRLVGVPGDHVQYKNKRLTINGEPAAYDVLPPFEDPDRGSKTSSFSERLTGQARSHRIANEPGPGSFPAAAELASSCELDGPAGTFDCLVPAGHYLAMGDNRDHSADSRFWGFVPQKNLVGRAFFIWLSLRGLDRIGSID